MNPPKRCQRCGRILKAERSIKRGICAVCENPALNTPRIMGML